MKKVFLFLSIITLLSCDNEKKVIVGNRTTMDIDLVYDAGTVIKGEMINAKFNVTNTGEFPLVIAEVVGSCTCTVADYPDEPLAPGESGVINAHVNTDRTGTGLINKTLSVTANTKPHVTELAIKAKVVVK